MLGLGFRVEAFSALLKPYGVSENWGMVNQALSQPKLGTLGP